MNKHLLAKMKNSPVHNYATAGLSSHLIGGGDFGKVRLLTSDRDTREFITPHSHRYGFSCLVLRGEVHNTVYKQLLNPTQTTPSVNRWWPSTLFEKNGGLGEYDPLVPDNDWGWYQEELITYNANDWYSMSANDIHSIWFSRNTEVLFFEGPQENDYSRILEPYSNGQRVPTFNTAPWMFRKFTEV